MVLTVFGSNNINSILFNLILKNFLDQSTFIVFLGFSPQNLPTLKNIGAFLKQEKEFKIIFEQVHDLQLQLQSEFIGATQEEIRDYYRRNLQKDDINGRTTYGIHLDDYMFLFDGFNSFEFCSLGQQKMSYLSLIFAYIELFRYKFSSYPIVLIDDVSGELDSRRWKNLIEYLEAKNFQVIITTANENFKQELEKIKNSNKIYVDSGSIGNL